MKEKLIWILLLVNVFSYCQEKRFLNSGKTFKIDNKYYVNEIILNSDSTYVQKYYEFKDESGINDFQNSKPKLQSTGSYSKRIKYYIFDQKSPNDFIYEYFKLTDKKLIYLKRIKGKWKKGARFKLITK